MRKFLIALLLIVPLQISWASIATYCGHESVATVNHPGHHEHQHKEISVKEIKQSGGNKAMSLDLDCGVCHLVLTFIAPSLVNSAISVSTLSHDIHTTHNLTSEPSPRPDRPNWFSPA
jgi:cystathionine beta-lyase/cystathionine gamma-synthase